MVQSKLPCDQYRRVCLVSFPGAAGGFSASHLTQGDPSCSHSAVKALTDSYLSWGRGEGGAKDHGLVFLEEVKVFTRMCHNKLP